MKTMLKESSNDSTISSKRIKLETITSNYKQSTISTNKNFSELTEEVESQSDLKSKVLKKHSQSAKKKSPISNIKSELETKPKKETSLIATNEPTQTDEFIDEIKLNFDFSN
jgi:hypothetical protein